VLVIVFNTINSLLYFLRFWIFWCSRLLSRYQQFCFEHWISSNFKFIKSTIRVWITTKWGL